MFYSNIFIFSFALTVTRVVAAARLNFFLLLFYIVTVLLMKNHVFRLRAKQSTPGCVYSPLIANCLCKYQWYRCKQLAVYFFLLSVDKKFPTDVKRASEAAAAAQHTDVGTSCCSVSFRPVLVGMIYRQCLEGTWRRRFTWTRGCTGQILVVKRSRSLWPKSSVSFLPVWYYHGRLEGISLHLPQMSSWAQELRLNSGTAQIHKRRGLLIHHRQPRSDWEETGLKTIFSFYSPLLSYSISCRVHRVLFLKSDSKVIHRWCVMNLGIGWTVNKTPHSFWLFLLLGGIRKRWAALNLVVKVSSLN